WLLYALLPVGAKVAEADAIGRKQPRERVDDDCAYAESFGHPAGMLAACAAKAGERVFGDVIAARDGDFLDGVGHVLNGNGDEPVSSFLGRLQPVPASNHLAELLADNVLVQRLVLVGAEYMRKILGAKLAEHHVGIGNGEGSAASVAGGTGIGKIGRASCRERV